jgi:tetratricopeptide (TPR) repeat protein
MNNLANSYYYLGRYPEAIELYEQALALRKAKLGPDHPDTLFSMHNLANGYAALRRYADAIRLREETLALRKAKLGPDHPQTLQSMNNLANSYYDVGRHPEAFKLREQTLALMKAKLGADHPDTFRGMNNLADSYQVLGRHPEALELYEQALALRKTKLGPDHPDTLWSMGNLADGLFRLGRSAEAIPIIDECLRRAEGRAVNPQVIPMVMNLRLRHFEKAKDVAACRATAEMWEKLRRRDANSLYNAARFRAVTAKVLRATDPSPDAATQADAEADRAMAWLRQAVAAGYKNVAHMAKDTDLDALRDRADFRALLAELGAGG